MAKKLTLVTIWRDRKEVIFRIGAQTHVGTDFGNSGEFTGLNKYQLRSMFSPMHTPLVRTLWVRGVHSTCDFDRLFCTPTEYKAFQLVVKEYNAFFAKDTTPCNALPASETP